MFPRLPLVALALLTSLTLSAAPRPSELKGFTENAAKESGKSVEAVRNEMVEALRLSNKYSEHDLARIGRGDSLIRAKEQMAMRFLENSLTFRTRLGLKAVLVADIQANAGKAFDAMATKPADLPPSIKLVTAVSGSLGEFDISLLKSLDQKTAADGKNLFYSPFSIGQALAMATTGAAGRTETQMLSGLKLGPSAADSRSGWKGLLESLNDPNSGIQLKNGNSLWARTGFKFKPEFVRANKEAFGAKVEELDFDRPDADAVINGWISGATNGKIPEMLKGPIPPSVVAYLINGVYFKGSWTTRFNVKNTYDQAFHLENGSDINVKTMHQKAEFTYSSERRFWDHPELGTQYLRMTYGKTSRFAMEFVLPAHTQKVGDLAAKLDRASLDQMLVQSHHMEMEVSLPRFKAELDIELSDTLKSLGMTDAFNEALANFSNMAEGHLFISKVKHKALVEVNEEGAEAAAATVVEMSEESVQMTPSFVADRPFYFAIRDTQTGAVLFSGVMRNPLETK